MLVHSNNTSVTISAENDLEDTLSNNKVTTVVSEGNNMAAITENGDLYCWGDNSYGQVGNGTTKVQTIPIKVLENVISVSLNVRDDWGCISAAITTNGDLYCWGDNSYGQVGNGTTEDQTIPVKVLENVISVSLNDRFSAATTTNGDLYCWGDNSYGQVGNGTTEDQTTPVKVLENVKSVLFNDGIFSQSSAAITTNGDLYRWGCNNCGKIGNGTTENQITPIKILENVKSVSLNDTNGAAIKTNGDLYCWGSNAYGQVGNREITNQTIPIKVLSNVRFIFLSDVCNGCTSAAIKTNGDLYCWGSNKYGQVGNGTVTEPQISPAKVLENVVFVFLNSYDSQGYTSAAITTNGDLYCWGRNDYGQVGNGTITNQFSPVKVLETVQFVSLDVATSTAITTNGDLYCWGCNDYEQIENGGIVNRQNIPKKILENVQSVSISLSVWAGIFSGCTNAAITTNGDLYCWGYNKYGQVGNGTTENQTTPVKVLGNMSSDIPNPPTGEETPSNTPIVTDIDNTFIGIV